ncbi:hypothetical protein [Flavobacterium koreense]
MSKIESIIGGEDDKPKKTRAIKEQHHITDNEETNRIIEELKIYIDDNISELKRNGIIILIVTILIALGIYIHIVLSLKSQLLEIKASSNPTQTVTYLIFRSTALGAIATTILILGSKITISSFDQAMRFTKRKMATYFLHFLYKQHKDQLLKEVNLDQIMNSFDHWNRNVASAFSNVNIESQNPIKDLKNSKKKKK